MILDVNNIKGRGELQRTYQWEFILPGNVSDVDSSIVSTYIQSVKFGNYNITDPLVLRSGPFQSFSAGPLEISDVSITILSPANGEVIKYFKDWKDKIVDPSGYFHNKSNYVRTAHCYLYNRQNEQKMGYKLVNIFPKNFPAYDLSYENEDLVKFNIDFAIDSIEHV